MDFNDEADQNDEDDKYDKGYGLRNDPLGTRPFKIGWSENIVGQKYLG